MYKEGFGNIPNKDKVRSMLDEAFRENPGQWIVHTYIIGKTCEKIAKDLGLDPEIAYASGTLHDIGKGYGYDNLAHMMEGYRILRFESYFYLARIALSHGFVTGEISSYHGEINVSKRDEDFIKAYLQKRQLDDYEKLIILLDNLINKTYLGLEERESLRKVPKTKERQERLEILKSWQDEFEARLKKPIAAYLPRPRYNKFPYNLLRKAK
ncbi:HD domain-containing protein [uncultured Anaerococcus sp.]|uniref:HD domain-containing protein n=1 Tax=uncultured Anaerococcus sp. TaxID=293428 RepID=UPI00288AB500|nr:HD domain-containing protein [uncultured Anaerococcus sp.]